MHKQLTRVPHNLDVIPSNYFYKFYNYHVKYGLISQQIWRYFDHQVFVSLSAVYRQVSK